MNLSVIRIVFKWLFVLCLPVILLTASVTWAVNSSWLYRYGFDKYKVGETTGLEQNELNRVADGIISYFNSSDELIDITVMKDDEPFRLFNEREIRHLIDVKGLFWLIYWLLLSTLIYGLIYIGVSLFLWKDKKSIAQGLLYGSGLTLILMVALGVVTLVDFDWFFYQFHLISFANDLWMLNPATDYLIMLFPQGFWYDAALFCVITTLVGALILGGAGWWRLKRMSSKR